MDSVDIIGKVYRIEWVDRKQGDGDYGECFADECRIEVALFQCEQQRMDTLLHECLHAVDHELHCGLSEPQTRRMATGLLALLRQNPALVAFLTGKLSAQSQGI